jgi:hypothetical protein
LKSARRKSLDCLLCAPFASYSPCSYRPRSRRSPLPLNAQYAHANASIRSELVDSPIQPAASRPRPSGASRKRSGPTSKINIYLVSFRGSLPPCSAWTSKLTSTFAFLFAPLRLGNRSSSQSTRSKTVLPHLLPLTLDDVQQLALFPERCPYVCS